MSLNNCSNRKFLAAFFLVTPLSLTIQPASAQVTVFSAPPTADEFRAALTGGARAPMPVMKPKYLGRARGLAPIDGSRASGNSGTSPESLATESANTPIAVAATAHTEPSAPAAGLPISFAPGSKRIAKRSQAYINTVVEVMRDDPSLNLIIEGHTDASGGYPRNMVLSWERAMGVYKVLVQRYGIEPKRLQPVGKGPNEPLPGKAPASGENRRVQFRLGG